MAWTDLDLAGPGSMARGGGVAAVAEDQRSTDTVWVGADGSVHVASYEPGTAWVQSSLAGPGSASLAAAATAIPKQLGQREAWWIGADGSVQAAYFEGGGWNRYTLAGTGSASVTGGITGVSKGGDSMEVWWIGADGSIQAAYHDASWNLYTLAGAGSASATGGITGVSKGGDSMEVWWIGADGSIQAAYHDASWNLYTLAGAGSASATGGITAVFKAANSMEVWWIGADGSIQASYFEGAWNGYALAGAGSASRTGGITGVFKGGNNLMEVWWIGADGSIQASYFEGGWKAYTLAGAGSAAPNSQIAAALRTSASMSTFWSSGVASLREGFTVPVGLEGTITTDTELGGSLALYLDQDGSTTWRGHARAHGLAGYHYGVSAFVHGLGGVAVAAAHTGDVHGTLSSGSRDDYWDETSPANPDLANKLGDYRFGTLEVHTDYSNTTTGFFLSALDWIFELGVELAVNGAFPGAGLIITVGFEAGSLISSGSLTAGARIVGSNMWLAGPAGMLFSIGVDSLARLGNRARGLTHEEYKWANDQVYQGALPPMDTLLLTDTIGGGGRPFTFKRWDGKITLNLGEKGWADPRLFTPGKYGQTFIHELVHACQIQHSQNISFTLSAILAQGKQVLGSDPYKYGKAGAEYTRLGIEQQAQIISDWFAGDRPPGTNQTGKPMDPTSPYFRYVVNNVRIGHF